EWRSIAANRRRVSPHAALGDVMEKREETVEILLGQRIIFVIVTPRAAQRQPQPDGGGGFDAVGAIFNEEFFGNDPALLIDHVVAVKAGRDLLIKRRIWQKVAGQLLDGELIEWQVAI